jgi:hypothetical protein
MAIGVTRRRRSGQPEAKRQRKQMRKLQGTALKRFSYFKFE